MDPQHHNLQEISSEINTRYFEGKLSLKVQWHGNKTSMPRTQIKLGSYSQKTEVIRINRLLDRAVVPKYFVEFIVYHEMLHHVLPPIISKNKRRKVHHPAFLKREKDFHDYGLAKKFLEEVKGGWLTRPSPSKFLARLLKKWGL